MKIGNIVAKPTLNLTQSNHGSLQNNQAFDFGELEGIAPADGYAEREYQNGTDPHQHGFHFRLANTEGTADILFHHTRPLRLGFFKRGEPLWKTTWDHLHSAIQINGKWGVLLDYLNRSIELRWYNGVKDPWTYWKTYADRQIPEPIIISNQSMRVTGNFKCKANNAVWNVRETPAATAKDVGDLAPNTEWVATEIENMGALVNGTTMWVKFGAGWVSAACLVSCVAEAGDPTCPAKLAAVTTELEVVKNKAEQLAIDNAQLAGKLSKFNGATGIIFPTTDL